MPTKMLVVDMLQSMSDLGLIGAPKVSETVVELYAGALDGITDEAYRAAVAEHMRTSKFYPKPSELVEIAERQAAHRRNEQDIVTDFWAQTIRQNPTFMLHETDREAYQHERKQRERKWRERGEWDWQADEAL